MIHRFVTEFLHTTKRALPLLVLALWSGPVVAQSLEVHELEAAPEKYAGKPVAVWGRVQSAAGRELTLVDSQIHFRIPERSRVIRGGAKYVELRGMLRRQGDGWTFEAEQVVRAPSERDEFERRRRLLAPDDPGGLRRLGRWARSRAEWYDDAELKTLANSALRESTTADRRRLSARRDADGMLKLAAEATSDGLTEGEATEIEHEALWITLSVVPKSSHDGFRKLSAEITKLWSDASQPVEKWPLPLDRYLAKPIEIYAAQDSPGRGACRRALWTEVVARELLAAAEKSAVGPAEFVERARHEIPDRPDVVRRLELAHLSYEAREPAKLSLVRLRQLAERFTELERNEDARKLLREGLQASRLRLDPEDAEARIELAVQYVEMLGDRQSAGELYLEAWQLAPGLSELAERLTGLGYQLRGSIWTAPPDESGHEESGDRPESVSVMTLATGTPASDVERQLGRPARVARVITGAGITEQWIYDGPPRFDVYVRRAAGSSRSIVIGVRAP